MNIKHFMKEHASLNIPLCYEEAYELGLAVIAGCNGDNTAQIESMAAMCALHNRATYDFNNFELNNKPVIQSCLPLTAAEQIAGICGAVFENDIAKSQFGFLNPKVPYAMDNCGMGGDLTVTANVSTLAALIAAAAGIPMLKHGSPANADKGKHGSSDFIQLLGINTFPSKEDLELQVEKKCFGYSEALDTRFKKIHMQTHKFAKLPHMNDIIGPITNPLLPKKMKYRVVGVNHLISPRLVAQSYKILNEKGITHLEHGLFVRGYLQTDSYIGMDEVSICAGGTNITELKDGRITEYQIYAKEFGIETVSANSISPPEGMSKGEFSLKILQGQISGPPLQMVLANAALLFYLAKMASNFKSAYQLAEETFMQGKALQLATELAEMNKAVSA